MDLGLDGKRFVLGGASKGLGRAIAEELVAEGARVLVVSRDPAAAAAELGARATACPADLATAEGVDAVVAAASELGGVDGLLVNTGGPPPGLALDLVGRAVGRRLPLADRQPDPPDPGAAAAALARPRRSSSSRPPRPGCPSPGSTRPTSSAPA